MIMKTVTPQMVLAKWHSLPLAEHTDWKLLEIQIGHKTREWDAAASFLLETDLGSLPQGRVELTNTGCYANIQEYQTRSEGDFEAHRDYVDVQVVIWGQETIYVSPLDKLSQESEPYSKEKDIVFYKEAGSEMPLKADPEHFVVLFPCDGHKPSMHWQSTPSQVRKVVVKIPFSD